MKNVEQIKAEAKKQIIELLNFVDCYNFVENGIDIWLDMWEKACSPQIEAIAEKSPYYDGKCKIVFPSEFPREINERGIINFCCWLSNYATRNFEEAKIDGYTQSQSRDLLGWCNDILNANSRYVERPEELQVLFDAIKSEIDKLYEFRMKIRDIYYKFENEDGVRLIDGRYYLDKEIEGRGLREAELLSRILRQPYARTQFLNEQLVEILSSYFPKCRFSVGKKLSRAVNNIASKYGLNKDLEWNKEFAKYADSINPLMVTKWTVISWHPIDYLTFCFGNSWSTCSNIDKRNKRGVKIGASKSSITSYVNEDYVFRGEHSAAALSYMFDKSSFIYYTVNGKYDGTHYESQDKESRIVFSLNEDMDTLLESRVYPQCNDDNSDDFAYRIPREIVQKTIADALGVPNIWKMKKGSSFCCDYAKSKGVHYPDYTDGRNKECNISWRGENPKEIMIGHSAICPSCGCIHHNYSSLNCEDCDPM